MDIIYSGGSTRFYVGLSSTMPDYNGVGVSEPSVPDYARAECSKFSSPMNGVVYNESDISFRRSRTEWFPPHEQAQYWVIFDGPDSEAHVLSCGRLDNPQTIMMNTDVIIRAKSLSVSLIDIPCEQ